MRAHKTNLTASVETSRDDAGMQLRPNDYVVAPIYVHDLLTQCAAHFLAWFATLSSEHIRDVKKYGLRASGGLVDEVDWWVGQCEADAEADDNALGYWPLEENGPWVYRGIDTAEVARLVRRHTRGWSTTDFGNYGYTVKQLAAVHKAASEFASTVGKLK